MSILSAIFDDANLSPLERIRLTAQLSKANAELMNAASPIQKIKAANQVNALLVRLGVTGKKQADDPQPDNDALSEEITQRKQTAQFYEFDPNRKTAQRKKDNKAALDLLGKIDSGEIDGSSLTSEQKEILAKYSGTGGALIGADGKKGSAYEYYTPKPIAEGMWELMRELGFSGGKVRDPSAGVGIFGATAPPDAVIDAVELNETAGRINELVNGGPGHSVIISPFEKVAANTPDEEYDAIITNVPFGELADRGGNQLHDNKYQKEPLQNYFILRSLEKLKPNGLAAFIAPPRVVSGKGGKEEELRVKSSFMAEFLGAYRLPNSVFGTASADTMTDVIVYRKFNRETLDKIAELREQSPQTLIESNVQWQPFIDGKYFDVEGNKRFILGEFIPKDPNKFRDVDRVFNPASVAEIGRMLKRFPDSRINWDLLNTAETAPILYRDGDTITQAGQTLQMKNGVWVAIENSGSNAGMLSLASKLTTPYNAFENQVSYKAATDFIDYMMKMSQSLDIPGWLRGAMAELGRIPDVADRGKYWNAAIVGLSVAQVLDERLSEEVGVNYLDEYPALSDGMQVVSTVAKSRPSTLGEKIKDGLNLIGVHYQKKVGFSAIWRGDVYQSVSSIEISADAGFEGLRYKSKSIWVSLDDARGLYGEELNPIEDPAWCISSDGRSVTKADDYYVGNYAEFMKRIDAEINAATDDKVRDKLLRQKLDAESRVDRVDVSRLTFNLFSPYVTNEEKAEFMRRFIHPSAAVIYDEVTGKTRVDIDIKVSNLSDKEKLMNRIGDYMKNGTITLGGAKLSMKDVDALKELRKMVNTANEQFNGWVRGNKVIMDRLDVISSDPNKLRFRQTDDDADLVIPGMGDAIKPHGYQNAFIRRMGREFGGINGHGVGLGKTLQSLASVQYVQSIGVKTKTFFVVPNSVLSNWRKEASRAYASMDGTLFIGLRENKNGDAVVKSSNFDEDLTSVMENRHSKIFMTLEAFERIRLRDETIASYESYLRSVDSSFSEKEDKKADERAKGKQSGLLAILSSKTGSSPYLEDMGVDSIVIDEGHCFPAGTLVDGVPIENIKVGDLVRSFNHETSKQEKMHVTAILRRRPESLVRVNLCNGKSIICTADHPFFTKSDGYVKAFLLDSCLSVMIIKCYEDDDYEQTVGREDPVQLQGLWQGIHAERKSVLEASEGDGEGVQLLSDVLIEGDLFEAGISGGIQLGIGGVETQGETRINEATEGIQTVQILQEGVRAEHGTEIRASERQADGVLLLGNVSSEMGCLSPRGAREEAEFCSETEGVSRLFEHEVSGREENFDIKENWGDGWEREAVARAAQDSCGSAGVVDGIQGKELSESQGRVQDLVRDRYRELGNENCHRSGWQEPSLRTLADEGREEGQYFEWVGVDSVEVLESTSDGRFGGLCSDGYVYDITVEGNHNFFAEGILVHNCYKNSTQVTDFKSAKFLSLSPASKRGLDAQAKAWFIRGKSSFSDGVLLLTATPVSNSPQEIYSMLSLSVGHDRVNDMCLGVNGADDFMNIFVQKENQDDVSIDGVARTTDVFVGLNNLGILRKAIGDVATIKTAEDVGEQIVVPNREEKQSYVALTNEIVDRLRLYKSAFRFAIDDISDRTPNRGDPEAFEAVSDHFGEPVDLIGHPFNLINKMTMLIADPDLDHRATFYSFISPQSDVAKAVVEQFNNKKITEERQRPGPMTSGDAIVGKKIVKDSGGDAIELLKIHVQARINQDSRIVIDTIDPDTQTKFEEMAEKAGLDLDVSVPPKLASMLENFQNEQASPRGIDENGQVSSIVKQIIFCDILPLHNKIKRLLTKRAGVPSGSIAIITGKTNNSPDEILDVQDGFNANGEGNKYRTIIANEKAEVGINLQKGTQAIHHLTIGWTPDSLEQRNGRGVRQGNKTQRVSIYYYDADGTFDTTKRSMVNKKADWIGQVLSPDGGDNVAVTGGLSKEQMEALIETVGDADAMTRLQETIAAKEAESRAATNRDKQMINIDTIRKQNNFLSNNTSPVKMVVSKLMGMWKLKNQALMLNDRINNPAASQSAVLKNTALLAEINARIAGIREHVSRSVTIELRHEEYSIDQMFTEINSSSRARKESDVEEILLGKKYPAFSISVKENSPAWNEWQMEVDMAKSMISESTQNFIRQSKEGGSYPQKIVELISEGQGTVLDGKPIVDGTFARFQEGQLGLAYNNGRNAIAFNPGSNSILSASMAAFLQKGELIYPGTAEYEQCLIDAARIEDDIANSGVVDNKFSEIVPEVAQRRKVEMLAEYSIYSYLLPQPYFPTVISEEPTTPVMRKIVESQKEVIKSIDRSKFVVSSSLDVREKTSYYDQRKNLIEYAKAHKMKLTFSDLGGNSWTSTSIEKEVDFNSFAASLAGGTEQEIISNALAYVRNAAEWIDYDGFGEQSTEYLPYSFRKAIGDAIKAIPKPAEKGSEGNATTVSLESSDDWVAMQSEYGFTKIVSVREFAEGMGEKAAWISKIGPKHYDVETAKNKPNAPINTWVIKRVVYDALIKEYGADAEKYSVRIVA